MRIERVAVEGGALKVAVFEGGPHAPCVVAVHGITATLVSWDRIADALGDSVTLIAPDLRGRGGSNAIDGPFGIHVHARDLVAILDHLGIESATLAGHSMGGFVAAVAAHQYASRFSSIVIMDGGMRMVEVQPNANVEDVTTKLVGPSIDRLRMTFASREEYRAFWQAHPGLMAEGWNDYVARYIDYDLVARNGAFASGVRPDAVFADAADTLFDELSTQGIYSIAQPLTFLRAARGFLDDGAIYSDRQMDMLRAAVPHADIETVDSNHFQLALGRASVIVADRIRKAAGA